MNPTVNIQKRTRNYTSCSSDSDLNLLDNAIIAIDILLPELWDAIFELLPMADLISCTRASLSWREALNYKLPVILFPQVFPILANYLETKDINTCRRICREWKSSVDSFLDHHPSHLQAEGLYHTDSDSEETSINHIHPYITKYWFSSPPEMQKFSNAMKNYTGDHPFISRRLTFCYNQFRREMFGDLHQVWQSIEKILEKFGSHVWYFRFVVCCDHRVEWYYEKAQWLLSFMPNLKVAQFFFNGDNDPDPDNDNDTVTLFEEISKLHPLPKLHNLIKLHCGSLPTYIMNAMLSKYSHIEKLHIDRPMFLLPDCTDFDFDGSSIQLPNLKELAMPLNSIEDIAELGRVTSPLEALTLINHSPEEVPLSELFRVLTESTFGSTTLLSLTLKLPEYPLEEDQYENLQLELPHVEKLKISAATCAYFANFDFLSSLKKLKELSLQLDDDGYELVEGFHEYSHENGVEVNKGVQFMGYFGRLNESNIWQVLPSLESVVLQRKLVLERNEYIKYRYDAGNQFPSVHVYSM